MNDRIKTLSTDFQNAALKRQQVLRDPKVSIVETFFKVRALDKKVDQLASDLAKALGVPLLYPKEATLQRVLHAKGYDTATLMKSIRANVEANKASGLDEVLDDSLSKGHSELGTLVRQYLAMPQAIKKVKKLPAIK
jgi:hypothetical protein